MIAEPIPARMRHLPLDRRGYPIPVVIMWTADGQPIFAANDQHAIQRCYDEDRCHICGGSLLRGRWFVSGAFSALAQQGQIMDGPLHDECAHYALKVCPYMAAPVYGKLVGRTQISRTDRKDVIVLENETDGLPRPEVFVAQMAVGQEITTQQAPGLPAGVEGNRHVRPKDGTVRRIEFWRHGEQLTDPGDIASVVRDVMTVLGARGLGLRRDSKGLLVLVLSESEGVA